MPGRLGGARKSGAHACARSPISLLVKDEVTNRTWCAVWDDSLGFCMRLSGVMYCTSSKSSYEKLLLMTIFTMNTMGGHEELTVHLCVDAGSPLGVRLEDTHTWWGNAGGGRVRVNEVLPSSPAYGELREGDDVLAINGVFVSRADWAMELLRVSGGTLAIRIRRRRGQRHDDDADEGEGWSIAGGRVFAPSSPIASRSTRLAVVLCCFSCGAFGIRGLTLRHRSSSKALVTPPVVLPDRSTSMGATLMDSRMKHDKVGRWKAAAKHTMKASKQSSIARDQASQRSERDGEDMSLILFYITY